MSNQYYILKLPIMQTISIKLPDNLAQKLMLTSKQEGVSKSDVIREALTQYLHNFKLTTKSGSFLDLAGDLCGCLNGPKDLSTSLDNMEGYGE